MAETSLEKAEKRYEQARARLQALRNREAQRERKLDTRRKVILGGALIELAGRDDAARAMLERLVRNLARQQDRVVFQDWEAPGRPGVARPAGEASGNSGEEALYAAGALVGSGAPAPSYRVDADAPQSHGLELRPSYSGPGDR